MAQDVDGRRIAGRYELGVQLGEGGVGIVWRAEDTLLGRPVAIKEVELPPAVRDKQRAALRARVIREARAAARLSHPGAVTLFDVVQDGGQDYIVMELVEAPTLDQLVAAKGPLDPRRAAMVGLRLLATLEAAHRAGIVHRDVKPSNVLVRDDGTTKLTDFGTASLTGDPELTVTGVVVGSPAFMAPEQIKGLEVGPATDLWALGATLYFAVEGEPPFKSSKAQFEVLNAIVNDPPRQARRLGALGPVVDRLLRKESHQRPKSADVWYQLRRVAATKDPVDEVPPDPPSTPTPRPSPHAVNAPPAGPAQAKVAPTGTVPAADVPVGTVPAEAKSAVGASASAAPDAGAAKAKGAPASAIPDAGAAPDAAAQAKGAPAGAAPDAAAQPKGAPASAGPADGAAARGTSAGDAPGRPTSAESAPPEAVPADRTLAGDASAEGVPAGASPGAADSAGAAPGSGAAGEGAPAGGGAWLRRRWRRSGG